MAAFSMSLITWFHLQATGPKLVGVVDPSTAAVDRCVEIFKRPDGMFGFEESRRDPEDIGGWTPVTYYSVREYATEAGAMSAGRAAVPWLPLALDGSL